MTLCSIPGCHREKWARGWCGTHYRRWKTRGTTDDPAVIGDLDRYLSYCAPPDENGCRLWTGHRDKDGYGRITIVTNKVPRTWVATRFGYTNLVGPIGDGLCVCHSCDTPSCQTPEHWWLGTNIENSKDRHAKGRTSIMRGAARGHAKLTDDQVREIRARAGTQSYRSMAAEFGVAHSVIGAIVLRKTWTHI